jgi:hypothetical protein
LPGDEPDRRDQRHERQRDRQEEHVAPADLGHQPAEDEAEREPGRAGGRVDRQRPVAQRALGEARRDDGQAGGRREGRRHALDEAGEDQQRAVVGQPAKAGRDEEHGEPDEEHPPAAEQVRGAPAEQQEAAVAEHVAADDPLQRAGGHVEVLADRGERDADHRDVEGVEEEGAAQHEQHGVGMPAQPVGAAVERRRLR